MNFAQKKNARERMKWIEMVREEMLTAFGDDVIVPRFNVHSTVDPLKFILKIPLLRPLAKTTRAPLRQYIRCWASEFSCDVPHINIQDRWIQAEVLTQHRVWSRNELGRFKKGRRFEGGTG